MKNSFIDFLSSAWTYNISLSEILAPLFNYKFSPLPIIATYILFDSLAIIRRLTKIAYVPMYFMFFPTGHSDRLYAQYFDEDDFYGQGARLSKSKKLEIEKDIRQTAVISMLAAAVAAPYLCGFVAAQYMSPQQFNEFLIFLLFVKGALIIKSLRLLRSESL